MCHSLMCIYIRIQNIKIEFYILITDLINNYKWKNIYVCPVTGFDIWEIAGAINIFK